MTRWLARDGRSHLGDARGVTLCGAYLVSPYETDSHKAPSCRRCRERAPDPRQLSLVL